MDNSDRPNKRARTDAQLEQKRMVDRVKQKANRAESKTRLENIEKDVIFLRETIGNLVQQLNVLPPAIRSNVTSTSPSMNFDFGDTSTGASASDSPSSSGRASSRTEPSSNYHHSQPITFGSNTSSSVEIQSDDIMLPEVLECYCGLRHSDPAECVERKSFNMLFDSHRALSQSPYTPVSFPLNPTLPNLLLQNIDDNALTKLVGSTLRQFKTYDTKTVFGLYFLTYRLLRWRAYPNPQWYADVPDIMKPTHIQNTELHPVCLDFIPWPMLRNHLCLNQNTDARHSISLYLQCIRLIWPPEKELLVRDPETGKIELHKDFEAIVCDARSWGVTDKWRAMFPHLLKHIE